MSNKYQCLHLLGRGTFGQAWLVRRRGEQKAAEKKLVLKKVQLQRLSEKELDQALTEVAILARCKHTNVIRYCEAFVENSLLHVVMEFADGGDLRQKIVQQKGVHFSTEVILNWFVQICFAVKYIHSRHILHRDLKTQNIFLTIDNIIKLGDFGISRVLSDNNEFAETAVGTPYYFSPEICQKQVYNHKSDIWSLGCILYELCALEVPFRGPNILVLATKIVKGEYKALSSHVGPILEDLVKIMLQVEPKRRPSAEQILCIPALQPTVLGYQSRQKTMVTTKRSLSSPSSPNIYGKRVLRSQGSPSSPACGTSPRPRVPSIRVDHVTTPRRDRPADRLMSPVACSTPPAGGRCHDIIKNDRTPPGSAEIRKATLKILEGATPKISAMIRRQRGKQPKDTLPGMKLFKV